MTNYDNKRFGRLAPQSDLYTRPNTRAEYQLFSNDYFTGSDVSFYMGDIWIDDIVDLEFAVIEQSMPVYGYASYTPDIIIKGNRIIQGAFTINFKSVGYINEVLRYRDPIVNLYRGSDNATKQMLNRNQNLEETLKLYGIKSFEELANQYEEQLWGASSGAGDAMNNHRPYFNYYDETESLDEGLEIKIAYGPREAIVSHASNYRSNKSIEPNSTVETIVGVQITGVQKGVYASAGGAPVTERYTFIARDINGGVSLD